MLKVYTGGLSQLPVVEMSWGKNSKKKPSVLTNFCFLIIFVRHIGPMVTRYTGSLSQLPVVKMSWGKKPKKKLNVLTNFHHLVYFIRYTGCMVTTGHPNVQTLISLCWSLTLKQLHLVNCLKLLWIRRENFIIVLAPRLLYL